MKGCFLFVKGDVFLRKIASFIGPPKSPKTLNLKPPVGHLWQHVAGEKIALGSVGIA